MATGEKELFWNIWRNHDHFCEVCDLHILYFNPAHFAHILSKAENKYPKFKLHPDNISVMCLGCHTTYDHENHKVASDRRFDFIIKRAKKLIDEYKMLFK